MKGSTGLAIVVIAAVVGWVAPRAEGGPHHARQLSFGTCGPNMMSTLLQLNGISINWTNAVPSRNMSGPREACIIQCQGIPLCLGFEYHSSASGDGEYCLLVDATGPMEFRFPAAEGATLYTLPCLATASLQDTDCSLDGTADSALSDMFSPPVLGSILNVSRDDCSAICLGLRDSEDTPCHSYDYSQEKEICKLRGEHASDSLMGLQDSPNYDHVEVNCGSSTISPTSPAGGSTAPPLECLVSERGSEYRGHVSVTSSGLTCKAWASDLFPEEFQGEDENYCRNPDNGWGGPWCYVIDPSDPSKFFDYCDIPKCATTAPATTTESKTTTTITTTESPPTTTAPPTIPSGQGCPSPWKEFESSCYLFSDDQKMNWHDARALCGRQGGHLVAVNSAPEHEFLTQTLDKDQEWWTGGSPASRVNPTTWTWDMGDSELDASMAYTKWSSNEPNSAWDTKITLAFKRFSSKSWDWATERKGHFRYFICEAPRGAVLTGCASKPCQNNATCRTASEYADVINHLLNKLNPHLDQNILDLLKVLLERESAKSLIEALLEKDAFSHLQPSPTSVTEEAEDYECACQGGHFGKNCEYDLAVGWLTYGSHEYRVFDDTALKRADAAAVCEQTGAGLLAIRNEREFGFLMRTLTARTAQDNNAPFSWWTAGKRQGDDFVLELPNGEEVDMDFRRWGAWEPDNTGGHEDFVLLKYSPFGFNNFKMFDEVGTIASPFICKRKKQS